MLQEKEWKDYIISLKNKQQGIEIDNESYIKILKELFPITIKNLVDGKFGVAFSGGVDSTLIAFILKKLGYEFPCYTVGLQNSQDVISAKKVSERLNLNLKIKVIEINELENIIKNVVKLLKVSDVTKVSVASVLYAILEMAKNDEICALFTGLGSEEIFAGYDRHLKALDEGNWDEVHNECWNGLLNMWERDLSRDLVIAEKFGIKLLTPFLDKEIIINSMKVHPIHKISREHKKIILREVAEEIELPKEFAWRQKKAAQYGSSFIKGMDKIAKKNKFRYKREYLESLKG